MVGFRDENLLVVPVKRENVWGGPTCTVLATPTRFKKNYPMNSDVFDGGFVRMYDPAMGDFPGIEMFLHGETSGAVRRIIKEAKLHPVLCSVVLVRNIYESGRSKLTLDYRRALNAHEATHAVRSVRSLDVVQGNIDASIPIEGQEAQFVAVRLS